MQPSFSVLCGSLFTSLHFLTDTSKMSEPAKMSPELAFLLEREKIEEAIVEQFELRDFCSSTSFAWSLVEKVCGSSR